MNERVISGGIQIIAFAVLGFYTFDMRRVRAHWANFTLALSSLIGIAMGIATLLRGLGWLARSREAAAGFSVLYGMAGGLLFGFVLSVLFSGQMRGRKRDEKQA